MSGDPRRHVPVAIYPERFLAMPETRSKVGGWPLATALAALLAFLFFVRGVLLPFVLAAAVAFILTPVVDHMHRRLKTPRWIVVLVIYLILVGCLALVGY